MNNDLTNRKNLRVSANKLYQDCLFTSKEHFLIASNLRKWHYILGTTATAAACLIVVAASTTLGLVGFLIPLSSLIALIASAIITTWNPGKETDLHQRIGSQYLSIQKRVQNLIDVDMQNSYMSDAGVKSALDEMNDTRDRLLREHSSVVIPERIHKKVKKKIESGEAEYNPDNGRNGQNIV